ncbi:DUF4870 domain-containing protein [Flavobacterium luteum]|uniref:DUF4870 domain-containing protein n=1 Tax=Flavobacterium luteum TaxID=2026654 RepID=A0A7J5ABT9_9FLAO|nr:DUF4870 domain-containing protein [Flavobacterium luteum]KAB1155037.1 DUF4870 domain-containing protein [Flavobacterium luteum]
MEATNNKNTATLLHLSALSQYLFPFGNFIFPILIWSATKEKSEYLDEQGKQVINFQLSLFVYSLILALIAIPILLITVLRNFSIKDFSNHNEFPFKNINIEDLNGMAVFGILAVIVFFALKVLEFFLIILASVKASNGMGYNYPITIPFLK